MTEQISIAARVRALEERGVTTRHAQARELGIGYSTLMRHLSNSGETAPYADLGRWVPPLATEHRTDPTTRKLQYLAQAAEGVDTKYKIKRGYAVQWARALVAEGKDVTYSQIHGFRVVRHGREWYLKTLLDEAERFITGFDHVSELEKERK